MCCIVVEPNLLATLLALYVAGSDTTSASLYWAFLWLIMFPEAQERVLGEIEQVAGNLQVAIHYSLLSFII